jgi:hypothetical protein
VFDFDFAYYARNIQLSFLIMNVIAGFYFVLTRFVSWSSISEAVTMEKQGKYLLLFCSIISTINILEIGEDGRILGWLIVMIAEFSFGALLGLVIDRYYRM